MEHEGRTIHPAPGYMIVKKAEPGKTSGGILVPDRKETEALYVEEVSPQMLFGDKVVPTELRQGDRVFLRPDARAVHMHGTPPNVHVVSLDYLVSFSRATSKVRPS